MNKQLKILLLEDSRADAEMIQRLLIKEKMNCTFHLAMDKPAFLKALDEFLPSVILSDHSLPQFNSSEALSIARQKLPDIPFIMVTGTVSEEFAANIIKQGADDYILKDRMARLPAAIKVVLEQRTALKEITDYKYALDQSAIVSITDIKGRLIYVNHNFCKTSGYTDAELIGQKFSILNSGYHQASYMKQMLNTIKCGQLWRGEVCNKAKDGNLFWADTTIIPFLDEKKIPYQHLSISIDITEEKKTEYLLKISEEKYRKIFYKSPLPIWIFNLETLKFLEVNEAAMQLYGYSRDEFLSMTLKDIRPAEDIPALLKDLSKIKGSLYSRHGTWRHLKKNGEMMTIELIDHQIEFNNTNSRIVIVNDITEKKKAEEELKESELRLNEAQTIAHIANWEIDFANNSHTWSDELYRIFGLNKAETKPSVELFLSFLDTDDRETSKEMITDALQHYTDSKIDFCFKLKEGKKRYGHIEWRFNFDEYGKPLRVFGILQDITERKEAEASVKLLEKKILAHKVLEQKKIARAVLKGQEKERNFIGQELHDNVNQILAGTKMHLSSAGKKDEKVKDLIKYPMELIDLSIEEIRRLCQKLVTPKKSIRLNEQVQDLLINLSENIAVQTSLTYTIADDMIPDDLKLNIYRIIQELLNNVFKYAEAQSLGIVIMAKAGFISITVTDDGKGFNTKVQRRGIGISNIIYRAECFSGKVSIKSSPGKGCKVHVKFPY